MNESVHREATRIAVAIGREGNRDRLRSLLEGYDVVDVADGVPDATDMCIVDDHAIVANADTIEAWKRTQRPVYAPVLLLTEADHGDPWTRYADLLGDVVDGIQPIPASRSAIRGRIDAQLETRRYSLELAGERRLNRRLFETSPIAKTVLDTEGNIVRANEHAEAVFGLTKSDIADRKYDSPVWEIVDEQGEPIPSDDLPFARVLSSGDPVYGYEHGIVRPDGEPVWLSINMAPLRDERGEIEYLVAAMDDITERKMLERELRETNALHAATLRNIHDSVFITDDDGEFTYVCPNTRFIFRYTPDDVRALGNVRALLGGSIVGDTDLRTDPIENAEHVITDADGEEHTVLVSVHPVSIQGGTRLYTIRDITDRKRQEERFQAFVEHSSDIVTVIDKQGTIQYVSPSVERILGYTRPSGLVGEQVFDFIHPGDLQRVSVALLEALDEPEDHVVGIEYRAKHADGSWRWVESRATVSSRLEAGHVVTTRDITDYRKAKTELEEHATHLEQAQEIANLGHWYIDVETGEIEWSDEIHRIFGIPREETITYETFLAHVHPDDREYVDRKWTAALDGADYDFEHRIVVDDEVRWVHVRAEVEFGPDGTPSHALGVVQDVTDAKERGQRLEDLEETRSLALSAANAGIWEWDIQTGEVSLHRSCEQLLGLEPDRFEGTFDALLDHVHPADRETVAQTYGRAIRGAGTSGLTFRIQRPDGTKRWVQGRWTVQSDASGTRRRLLGVVVDVTEHQERIKHLRVLDDVLRHNFHNQMNVIRGYAETIESLESGVVAEYAEHIIESGDRLLSTTDNQREITRILAAEPRVERVDVQSVVDNVAVTLQSEYPSATVETDTHGQAVAMASEELGSAVEELVENAIRHNDSADRWVAIDVELEDDTVVIVVSDNGPGIPAMERNVVTGERTLESLYHGSGLGLWMVSWIVQRSGGTLTFDSSDRGGTAVLVRIPRASSSGTDE
jgi:PAS domain S-box-containing protein